MDISDKQSLHLAYGRFLLKARKFDSAIFHLSSACDGADSDVIRTALFEKASALFKSGRLTEALDTYEVFLKNGEDADALVNKAGVLLALRRFGEAASCCDEALRCTSGKSTAAAMNLFSALRASGNIAEATARLWGLVGDQPVHVLSAQKIDAPDFVTVACVKWGDKYGWEYVENLFRGVSRFWSHEQFVLNFVCFCDKAPMAGVLDDAIKVLVMAELKNATFFWGKSVIFSENAGLDQHLTLFLDLDTIIAGNVAAMLDEHLESRQALSVLRAERMFNERGIGNPFAMNTSVMIFVGGPHVRVIHSRASEAMRKYVHRFDHWMEMVALNNVSYIRNVHYVDYRVWKATESLFPNASLILFPGNLKPADVIADAFSAVMKKSEETRRMEIQNLKGDVQEFADHKNIFDRKNYDVLKRKPPSVNEAEALFNRERIKQEELDAFTEELNAVIKITDALSIRK